MNIGHLSAGTGVAAKTIRYYESIGLIPPASRKTNGYRRYDEPDVHRLSFIQRARSLGFSVTEVRGLLALWHNKRRTSAGVKAMALKKVEEIDRKVSELKSVRRAILDLAERCGGNDRPECPIIDELAEATFSGLKG
jgi:MerR family copper efflux transcriptional regulator